MRVFRPTSSCQISMESRSMRNMAWVALACVAASLWLETATAQPPFPGSTPGPYTQPAVSPYLNLTRRGSSAGVNYFGLVRPQLEFRNAYRELQQQSVNNQFGTAQSSDPQTGLPHTGHTAVFLNTGGYFLNNLGGAGQRTTGTIGQRTPGTTGAGQMSQPGQPSRGASSQGR
jgi:hypothetical protein